MEDRLNRDEAVPTTVRGLRGWQDRANGVLVLILPDGVNAYFQLTAGSMEDLVRIAEQIDWGPWPDMSWVGTR